MKMNFYVGVAVLLASIAVVAIPVPKVVPQNVRMLMEAGSLGGAIFLNAAVWYAILRHHQFTTGNTVRVALWTIIGVCGGLQSIAGAYYRYFYPESSSVVGAAAAVVAIASLLCIIISVVLDKRRARGETSPPNPGTNKPDVGVNS